MAVFTKNHKNRKAHNWLIYDSYERVLLRPDFIQLLRGALYDLGAGESPYKSFFLQHANQYIAIDWTSSYHETRADIVADLNEALPIDNEVADTVVALSVLEHLHEPQMMLSEAFRILKSEGAIVLQVPWQWWIHEDPYDFFRYTPYGIKYLLEKAGFVDVKVEPQAGFFTTMTLKMNYFSMRFIRGPRALRWAIRACLLPMWYCSQKAAPMLDRLDNDWALEASGYFVTARKP